MRSGLNLAICMGERVGDIANEHLPAYLVLFFTNLCASASPSHLQETAEQRLSETLFSRCASAREHYDRL